MRLPRLITPLVAALLGLLSIEARAGHGACHGRDLIAKLATDDAAAHAALVERARAIPNGEAVFWRVEPPGGGKPSWLFGTVHYSDPRVTELSPAAREAIAQSDHIAIESAWAAAGSDMAKRLFEASRYFVLPPGEDLYALLGEPHATRLREHARALAVPETLLGVHQPWAVLVSYFYPPCEWRRWSEHAILDAVIAASAEEQGRELHFLEDTEEQARMLSCLPREDQLALLRLALGVTGRLEDSVETTIAARNGAMPGVLYAYYESLVPPGHPQRAAMERASHVLVHERNLIMRDSSIALMNRGPAFIAVGYFHLLGGDGLVALLRKAGYKVTAIN